MTDPFYDRKEQFEQVQSGLLPGENIIAVADAVGSGTGFLALTDRRVILQDKSFVGKKFALTSIPFSRITTVSVVSNKSWSGGFFSTSAIAVTVGTHIHEVEFRGVEKAHYLHNAILANITQA